MPPEISTLQLPEVVAAPRLMALPPRYEVSPETRRMLIELLEDEEDDEDEVQAFTPAPIADMAAYRARRLQR